MQAKVDIKVADVVLCDIPAGNEHQAQALVVSVHKRIFGQPLVSLVFARECRQNEAGYSPHQFLLTKKEEIEQAGLSLPSRFDMREVVVKPFNEIGKRTGHVDLETPERRERYLKALRAAKQVL